MPTKQCACNQTPECPIGQLEYEYKSCDLTGGSIIAHLSLDDDGEDGASLILESAYAGGVEFSQLLSADIAREIEALAWPSVKKQIAERNDEQRIAEAA